VRVVKKMKIIWWRRNELRSYWRNLHNANLHNVRVRHAGSDKCEHLFETPEERDDLGAIEKVTGCGLDNQQGYFPSTPRPDGPLKTLNGFRDLIPQGKATEE
jgi:hypothetical protein